MPSDFLQAARDAKEARLMRTFAAYAECDWCGALAKMPCRDSGFHLGSMVMERPHVSRKKIEE